MNREVVLTYLEALIQATEKKGNIIVELTKISKDQERVAQKVDFELDEFTRLLDEKEVWIQELETIDNGFGPTFDRIKDTLVSEKEQYKEKIVQLQTVIGEVTTKAVELQVLEKRNKLLVDRRIAEGKAKVKTATVSNKIASSYYKNMANTHYNASYFMDQKK
ncbi:MAG: hypothetical protein Q4G58_09735 [bacterium]|nr:hypothetical protein [bacterium]